MDLPIWYTLSVRFLVSRFRALFVDMMTVLRSGQKRQALLGNPLYSNAIYFMLATVIGAVFGFVFWILVARLYSPEDVGFASALLSSAGLLSMLSGLGVGDGMLRFLDTSRAPQKLLNTGFSISGLLGLLAAVVFVLGLRVYSPSLVFIREDPLYLVSFVLFIPASTLSTHLDQAFMAKRRAWFVLVHNMLFSVMRLILPLILVLYFTSFGIFGSWSFAMMVSLAVSILFLLPRVSPGYQPRPTFDRAILAQTVPYSFASYLGSLLWSAPAFLLPLLVLERLSADYSAFFFLAYTLSSILTIVPTAVSTSLIAEASHDETSLQQHTWRSLKVTFVLLTPAAVLFMLLADKLLLLYGKDYVQNGVVLLRWLVLAVLPTAVNILFFSVKRVQKKLKSVVVFGICNCALTMALAAILLPGMGINGVGAAWFISQAITAVAVVAYIFATGSHKMSATQSDH